MISVSNVKRKEKNVEQKFESGKHTENSITMSVKMYLFAIVETRYFYHRITSIVLTLSACCDFICKFDAFLFC